MYNALDRLRGIVNEDKVGAMSATAGGPGNPNTIYNQKVTPTAMNTAAPAAPVPAAQMALDSYSPQKMALATPSEATNMSTAAQNMNFALNEALNMDNAIMKNAKQTGLELASKRGLLNSSIAVGSAQRASLEAAGNVAQGIFNRGNAQTDFYNAAKLLPLQSALNFSDNFSQLASENPEVYTPGYINGMTNFFMSNMQNVLKNFFGDDVLGGG